ncbi:Beta-hexosaminidase [Roseobacter fucihabitans]|uniref:beta-N-acetylhexosaminidase n=1 Tax=Roseobacter fucihabitans TaxID=1537242 RepID=A0ABZ2BVA8_9RHOB|nr:beta-N-acetylhexosaminidase [Roseobacter litoralis]MBC6967548.1 Beta-hexosaminidase [Roseobacter litoralis]
MSHFGATILDAEGLRLSGAEKTFFREANPFGFILFARNIDTPDQVRALCAEMRDSVGREALITIDQEGGRVQRLRAPQWTEWPAPLDFVTASGEAAEQAMFLRYRLIAAELKAIGIDSNCAPMVDLAGPQTHDFLRNRCYGSDPGRVAALGRAVARGLLEGGVLPVLKHIPGHGRASLDSHNDLPHVSADHASLSAQDFAPFALLNDLPMGMTAHLVYEALDDRPATLSPKVMRVIREEIGFDNLIMTDDISMKALTGSLTQISRDALAAGCDVILYCNGPLAGRREVAEAAGVMNAAAQTRAERALKMRKAPVDIDIEAVRAQLDRLLNKA